MIIDPIFIIYYSLFIIHYSLFIIHYLVTFKTYQFLLINLLKAKTILNHAPLVSG